MESTIECCVCAYKMIVSAEHKQRLIDNGRSFWCINGHPQSFTKSTVDILKERINIRDSEINSLKIKLEQATKPIAKKRGRPSKK